MKVKMTKEIPSVHGTLSACSVQFLEFVEKTPGTLNRSDYTNLFGLNIDEGPVQPWPVFINRDTKNIMKEAAVEVFNLIKCIPERLFGNDIKEISRYFEVPEDMIKMQLDGVTDEHLANIVARGDFIYSPSSGVKCLEYNVSAGIGGWQLAFLEPYYLDTPITAKFIKEYRIKICNNNLFPILLENFLKPAVDKFSGCGNEINIAIVSDKFGEAVDEYTKVEEFLNRVYVKILALKYNDLNLKGDVVFCDCHHLDIVDDCVFYRAKKIHVLVEMYHGELPHEILDAFRWGEVLVYNGPVTALLSNKLNLALLSENEDSEMFSTEERNIIKKYISWTRKIVPGEEDFILSNKDKLVIKPSDRLSGEGVYIGRHIPPSEWKGLVELALFKKNWLVQEYIESFPYLFQTGEEGYAEHDAVWGLFVLGSEYGGGFLRIINKEKNSKGVINVHQGAEVTPLVEVEE